MFEEKQIEQIKQRKIQTMIEIAKKGQTQTPVEKHPVYLTDVNFSSAVTANELLVVDYWAPWCGPCRMLAPIIEQLATEYAGKATFGKMNVDENQIVPSKFGIMSIPTIMVFHRGKAVETIVGAYPKTHIESLFKKYLKQ